jgi:hypothetical protein
MFVASGLPAAFLGLLALLLKILLANIYSFDWQKPLSKHTRYGSQPSEVGRFLLSITTLLERCAIVLFPFMAGALFYWLIITGESNGQI